jgi:hypothetical protein
MATCPAKGFDFDPTKRKIQIIIDDNKIWRYEVQILENGVNNSPSLVHPCLGKNQGDWQALNTTPTL